MGEFGKKVEERKVDEMLNAMRRRSGSSVIFRIFPGPSAQLGGRSSHPLVTKQVGACRPAALLVKLHS